MRAAYLNRGFDEVSVQKCPASRDGYGKSILAVIVLHKLQAAASVSVQSLTRACEQLSVPNALRIRILVVDNSPASEPQQDLPPELLYISCPQNLGLANAYNRAIEFAAEHGYEWLFTLDQDTELPQDLIDKLLPAIEQVDHTPAIAAVVPILSSRHGALSPYYFQFGAIPRWLPQGYCGIPEEPVFAFNSAACIRVDALQQIGGYDPYFWLDNSDASMFRNLHKLGKWVWVAGDIVVDHEFSMKAMQQRVSPWRYEHILLAESAFWDAEMPWLSGAERTLRLFLRYLKHLKRGDPAALRKATLRFLGLRLFRSRRHRRRLFQTSVEKHLGAALPTTALPTRPAKLSVCMASYNGGHYIDQQLASILPQLGPKDEVVIVDDCSTDDTRDRIRALGDPRIRLIEHQQNKGVVRTFEDALRNATGDILFLSDDDDLWAPNKVARFCESFESNPDTQLVTSAVALIDSDGQPFHDSRWDRDGKFSGGFLRNILKNQYQGAAMAFRSSLLATVLPLPRDRGYLHDAWIGTTNDRAGGRTIFLPEPLLLYRRHRGNFSRKLSRAGQLRARVHLLWDHIRRTL